jgi:Domain of unknown function (DUF4159)/Prenyltransferase and squalene oxidase repeat
MSRFASLFVVLALAGIAGAQGKEEPLVKKVKSSIHKGVRFLVKIQNKADGSWEDLKDKPGNQGGPTALTLLALMQCEDIPDDPQLEQGRKKAIEAGLKSLRLIESDRTYVRAVQIMALVEASHLKSEVGNRKADLAIIKRNVDWLLDARVTINKKFAGWTYDKRPNNPISDASNSQYAMLALWYARQAGVAIERKVWEEIRAYYGGYQAADGSWIYSATFAPDDEKGPSLTMTVAGLCGLQIATMELNGGREQWQPNGAFKNCGNYGDDRALALALQWLGKNYNVKPDSRTYYHLYGLERAGRLTGNRFFGEHDWYREGCEFLVEKQQDNGSWPNPGGWDRWPHVNTAFALLFLSKGRTPVLISKLVHGEWKNGRNEADLDWNNDRNDLRHLTEYLAKENDNMFGKKPLAWQTYDIARAQEAYRNVVGKAAGAEVDAAVVADMKQSPILYITGHEPIARRFTDGEVTLIKRYIENGGFIFADACCGSADFDKSFKQWVKDTWDQDLEYLSSTHPVWTCENSIKPGEPYKLMGLNIGCRTVMLYSPQDMSCFWESNKLDDAKSQVAFRLGVNIIAYGTGRTPPLPRLTPVAVAEAENKLKEPRGQGAFRVWQIKHSENSQPAPKAMTNLMEHVHKAIGIEVATRAKLVDLKANSGDVRAAKFFYMHGKSAFKINKDDLAPLEFTLRHGGLLFADACCGNEAFDKSFRQFVSDLFPNEKLVRVPFGEKDRDPLFAASNNGGEALAAANIQCRTVANGKMLPMEPFLEGIKIDGRWVVLYSRYDIGCALERHTSPDCVGYAPESALRIATAVVRYNVRP